MEKLEIKELIKLNNLEINNLTREYLLVYLKLLLGIKDSQETRKHLLNDLKQFISSICLENRYMRYIYKNSSLIRNEMALDELLDNLDYLNERTFNYFEHILSEYENGDNAFTPRDFKILSEIDKYREQVLGLFLTETDLMTYYQTEDAIYYLRERQKLLPGDNIEKEMPYYGCYKIEEGGILREIRTCVPKITSLETMLINIHEYKHGIILYPYIGKKSPDYDTEYLCKQEEQNFRKKYLSKKLNRV